MCERDEEGKIHEERNIKRGGGTEIWAIDQSSHLSSFSATHPATLWLRNSPHFSKSASPRPLVLTLSVLPGFPVVVVFFLSFILSLSLFLFSSLNVFPLVCGMHHANSCECKRDMLCVCQRYLTLPRRWVDVFTCLFVYLYGVFLWVLCASHLTLAKRLISKQTFFPSGSQAFVCAWELARDASRCLRTQQACLIHEAASKLSHAPYISHCSLSSHCWIVSPKLSDTLSAGWMALVGG